MPAARQLARTRRPCRGGWAFLRATDGGSMPEYALLLAVVALVALAGAKTIGRNIATQGSYLPYIWPH